MISIQFFGNRVKEDKILGIINNMFLFFFSFLDKILINLKKKYQRAEEVWSFQKRFNMLTNLRIPICALIFIIDVLIVLNKCGIF